MRGNMKYLKIKLLQVLFAVAVVPYSASAEEMKYQPIDPAFGGSPFNGAFILGSAEAQKQFDPPERKKKPAVEEFEETIQRSLINRISQDIADMILGEDGRDSGTFSVGATTVDFHRAGDQVEIQIRDSQTGGLTTIELPLPQY